MPSHETHEGIRKALHIAFGLFAFTLRWLPWQMAALVAACAVLGNWLVLHRLVGTRVSRDARGYDAGIVVYPVMVLLLIVAFRNRLEIAGAAWAVLAFGDGFATLAGRAIGGPRLPWNRDKSWSGLAAFLAFGFVGAEVVYLWLAAGRTLLSPLAVVAITTVTAAVVESLPLNVNDNVTVPLFAALAAAAAVHITVLPAFAPDWPWLAVNTILAVAGYAARTVDASGLVGGWLLGAAIIVFGGWPLYAVLLAFFVIGTAMTRAGYRRKASLGLAQERGGRRGAAHAFSNVGVAAILAFCAAAIPAHSTALWFAAAAALATAAADTTASELGQLFGRRTFLPLTLRPVPVGTEGAISIEGTLSGLAGGAFVAAVATIAKLRALEPRMILMLTAAAFLGSWVESVAGSWNRTRASGVPNGALNFFNTAVGAGAFLLIAAWMR